MPLTAPQRATRKRQQLKRQRPNLDYVLNIPETTAEIQQRIQEIQQRIDANVLADNLLCPVCLLPFRSKNGLTSHMSTARTCSWYRLGKLKLFASSNRDDMAVDSDANPEPDVPVRNIGSTLELTRRQRRLALQALARQQWLDAQVDESFSQQRDLGEQDFTQDPWEDTAGMTEEQESDEPLLEEKLSELWHDFIQANGDPFIAADEAEDDRMDTDEVEPGPSTSSPPQSIYVEDCDESRRAGGVVTPPKELLEEWKKRHRMDVHEEEVANPYGPFSSECDWKVADWLIRDGPSNSASDRLLKIPGVSLPSLTCAL